MPPIYLTNIASTITISMEWNPNEFAKSDVKYQIRDFYNNIPWDERFAYIFIWNELNVLIYFEIIDTKFNENICLNHNVHCIHWED